MKWNDAVKLKVSEFRELLSTSSLPLPPPPPPPGAVVSTSLTRLGIGDDALRQGDVTLRQSGLTDTVPHPVHDHPNLKALLEQLTFLNDKNERRRHIATVLQRPQEIAPMFVTGLATGQSIGISNALSASLSNAMFSTPLSGTIRRYP